MKLMFNHTQLTFHCEIAFAELVRVDIPRTDVVLIDRETATPRLRIGSNSLEVNFIVNVDKVVRQACSADVITGRLTRHAQRIPPEPLAAPTTRSGSRAPASSRHARDVRGECN